MMATSNTSQTSLEEDLGLKVHLHAEDIVKLEVDTPVTNLNFNSMRDALRMATQSNSSDYSETPSSPSSDHDIEDYDDLQTIDSSGAEVNGSYKVDKNPGKGKNATRYEELNAYAARSVIERKQSIPIILKKSDKPGKYWLSADDVEIRKLLKMGIERV